MFYEEVMARRSPGTEKRLFYMYLRYSTIFIFETTTCHGQEKLMFSSSVLRIYRTQSLLQGGVRYPSLTGASFNVRDKTGMEKKITTRSRRVTLLVKRIVVKLYVRGISSSITLEKLYFRYKRVCYFNANANTYTSSVQNLLYYDFKSIISTTELRNTIHK